MSQQKTQGFLFINLNNSPLFLKILPLNHLDYKNAPLRFLTSLFFLLFKDLFNKLQAENQIFKMWISKEHLSEEEEGEEDKESAKLYRRIQIF